MTTLSVLRFGRALTLVAAGQACGGARTEPVQAQSASSATPTAASSTTPTAESGNEAVAATETEPVVAVTDPAALAALEQRGFSLANWLGISAPGRASNAALSKPDAAASSGYLSVVQVLEADLNAVKHADPHAGVEVHKYSHRLFNARWLRAETAHFELVAVMNRLDRVPFRSGSCGETRLVYRLAYTTEVAGTLVSSRLPLTLGVEIDVPVPAGGCAEVARRWSPPKSLRGEELAGWLTASGAPLDASSPWADPQLPPHRRNIQRVRWPSACAPISVVMPSTCCAASSRTARSGRLARASRKHTERSARLQSALRSELLTWLREPATLTALDAGTFVLPESSSLERRCRSPRAACTDTEPAILSAISRRRLCARRFSAFPKFAREGPHPSTRSSELPGLSRSAQHRRFHLLGDDPREPEWQFARGRHLAPPSRRADPALTIGALARDRAERRFFPAVPRARRLLRLRRPLRLRRRSHVSVLGLRAGPRLP